jgi:FkbM family methyltransferase
MKQTIYNQSGAKVDYEIPYEEVGNIKFHNVGRVIDKRIKSFYTKEPKTLEWIDSFEPNSMVVDVGANIGVYSLYAGKLGHKVYAFEPQALNFAELYTNIYLNKLADNIMGYNIALNNKNSIEYLSLLSMVPGQSHNDFALDIENQLKQGCVGFTLDHLVNTKVIPQPKYLKIDVDGLEKSVVEGSIETIKNCKSVLIELTENKNEKETLTMIESCGFKLDDSMTYKLSKTETNYILRSSI